MRSIFLTLVLIGSLKLSFACSCSRGLIDLPLAELGLLQTKTSGIQNFGDLIFVGKLLSISATIETADGGFRDLTFKVKKIYKGAYTDTIEIRTARDGDGLCGFFAPPATNCLIFTSIQRDGLYHTYRSDCCKSISKIWDEKRYLKYLKFLDAITQGIDGNYTFFEPHAYRHLKIKNLPDTIETIRFEIKNGQLDGLWKVTDNQGKVLEEGQYLQGEKHGKWTIDSYLNIENDYDSDLSIETEVTKYRLGKIKLQTLTIIDRQINWETGYFETVRKQIFKNGKLKSDEKNKRE